MQPTNTGYASLCDNATHAERDRSLSGVSERFGKNFVDLAWEWQT